MTRAILPWILAFALATPVAAQTGNPEQAVPPFVAFTVALVDENTAGGDTAVIVWGPHENGSDHLILLPQSGATSGELRKAVVTLVGLVKSGATFEPGMWLRGQAASPGIGERARWLNWVPRAISDLTNAEPRTLAGVGEVPFVLAVVEVR